MRSRTGNDEAVTIRTGENKSIEERAGRASGKVILSGEHAAVYGFRAVAVGLERGAIARAIPLAAAPCQLRVGDLELRASDNHDLARAFVAVVETFAVTRAGRALLPVRVEVSTSLPAGSGLGSSAAIGVALIRALDPRASEAEVLTRAMVWERVFHGNPSGIDALVAARGGCFTFERGQGAVPIRLPRRAFLCIGQSGAGASTRAMVSSVAALRMRAPEIAEATFAAIGAISDDLARSLRAGDLREVGRLMRANHVLLRRLGLSTPAIDTMCELARLAGAHGAKLTGGGGGGCVVALCATRLEADAVLLAWRREAFDGFIAPLGAAREADHERTQSCSPSEAGRPIT